VKACEHCIYSREIEVDVDSIKSLINSKRERLVELKSEPALSRNFYVERMYTIGISQLEEKLHDSNEKIMCHRYPESIKKNKEDFCGEYIGYS